MTWAWRARESRNVGSCLVDGPIVFPRRSQVALAPPYPLTLSIAQTSPTAHAARPRAPVQARPEGRATVIGSARSREGGLGSGGCEVQLRPVS